MDTLTLPSLSPNILKRTGSEAGLGYSDMESVETNNPVATESQNITTKNMPSIPAPPPALATAPSTAVSGQAPQASASDTHKPSTAVTTSDTNALKKRQKLSAPEKEAKEKERAGQKAKREEERVRKEKEKEEDKLRKEHEKVKKDEEKKARDAEKERKRLEREELIKAREEEKRKKEEEKDKKQRSQLRLNAFFVPPSLHNVGSTPSPTRGSPSPANSRRSSIISLNEHETLMRERSTSATPSKTRVSDFERRFPSFFLHAHTTLAPFNRFSRDEQALQYARQRLDEKMVGGMTAVEMAPRFNPGDYLPVFPYKRRKLDRPQPRVKEILEQLHGTSHEPIDLTESRHLGPSQQPLELLKAVSTRLLKFAEDVRPPYIGTYSRLQDPPAARKICRNPFTRSLPNTDYDYDSEAEWEDPGEGEDLDSEGEEELESEDGDDMEGFLDDEEDAIRTAQKRRLLAGDLEPLSTGLCWEDGDHNVMTSDLKQYRMEIILDKPRIPVDPYSTSYWQDSLPTAALASSRSAQPTMDPPLRIPLNTTNNRINFLMPNPISDADSLKPPPSSANTSNPPSKSKAPQAPKRLVTADVMEDFKRAIEGSDLTKAGLVEVLKKQFPQQTKDAIKDTIGAVAERVGRRGMIRGGL